MPASTPAAKKKQRRVRTGCLTCRARRRKCDERKPQCENCEGKGLSCRYGVNVTFVQERSIPGAVTPRHAGAYTRLKFLDGRPKAQSPERPRERTARPNSSRSNEPVSEHDEDAQHSPAWTGQEDGNARSVDDSPAIPRKRPAPDLLNRPSSSSNSAPNGGLNYVKSRDEQESELLRDYRYKIAPWIDVGDPKSTFGIELLLEAKNSTPLLKSILALTDQKSSSCNLTDPDISTQSEADQNSEFSSGPVRRAIGMLCMLRDIIDSEPRRWRDIMISYQLKHDSIPFNELHDRIDEASFWIYFKVDTAAALINSRPPMIPSLTYIRHHNSVSPSGSTPLNSSKTCLQSALFLLSRSLIIVFGGKESVKTPEYPDEALALSPPLSTRWTNLWSESQKWYSDRPAEMMQVYEVRGAGVSQIDMNSQACFPIILFTTSFALLANIAYHMTSLLLLSHRPRLVSTVAGSRVTSSPIWHAQSIVGIAESNESPDLWDPLLVASLILAAKSMSHESQQVAILDIFDRIKESAGLNLDEEINSMRSSWQIARDG